MFEAKNIITYCVIIMMRTVVVRTNKKRRNLNAHMHGKNITCRIQNPDIPQAGRGGAAHGGAAMRDGAGQDGTSTGRFAQETTDPLALKGIEDNCPERLFASTNKQNPM